jgi:hypothetical protein
LRGFARLSGSHRFRRFFRNLFDEVAHRSSATATAAARSALAHHFGGRSTAVAHDLENSAVIDGVAVANNHRTSVEFDFQYQGVKAILKRPLGTNS